MVKALEGVVREAHQSMHGIVEEAADAHAIPHNKVMVIDGQTVITGSFNFTKAAKEKNAENLLIIHDAPLAAKYSANWAQHTKHSSVYKGKIK